MTDAFFQQKMAEALQRINTLPPDQRGPLLALCEETIQRHNQLKTSMGRLHDCLDEWRLMMKYIVFDREAALRERDELRQRLNDLEQP